MNLSKLSNAFSSTKNAIGNTLLETKESVSNLFNSAKNSIKGSKNTVKNAVMAIMFLAGTGVVTKADASINTFNDVKKIDKSIDSIKLYKILKGEGLYKIARDNGLTLSELINLNEGNKLENGENIINKSNLDIIPVGESLIVKKNDSNNLNENKIETPVFYKIKSGDGLYNIAAKNGLSMNELITLNEGRVDKNGKKIIDKSNLSIIPVGKSLIVKKNKQEDNISPNQVTKTYTLSAKQIKKPENIVKASKKVQIKNVTPIEKKEDKKIKLAKSTKRKEKISTNHKNIRKLTLTKTTKRKPFIKRDLITLIKETQKIQLEKKEKNTIKKQTKLAVQKTQNDKIIKKPTLLKFGEKENFERASKVVVSNTVKWAGNKRNRAKIDKNHQIELFKTLNLVKIKLDRIPNDIQKRVYLTNLIKEFKLTINHKNIPENIDNIKLFNEYATLARKSESLQYYASKSFKDIYNENILKDFHGEWNLGLKNISKRLGIKNILDYNPSLKIALEKGREEGIKLLKYTVSKVEGTNGNYNAIVKNGSQNKIKFTEMTVAQVIEFQRKHINAYKRKYKTKIGLSAIGKYQFIRERLIVICEREKIDINTQKFSEEFQEKLAKLEIHRSGLNSYINGHLKRDKFQENMSVVWAGLPKDESNKSFHYKDGINKAHCSNEEFDRILDMIKNPKPESKILLSGL